MNSSRETLKGGFACPKCAKVMLSTWWDQKGVLYYELLKPGETINEERYRTQLIRLKRAITKKRPEYATRHEAIISIMTTLDPM